MIYLDPDRPFLWNARYKCDINIKILHMTYTKQSIEFKLQVWGIVQIYSLD